MTDEIISNLEPIEEGDLNLKDKFIGGGKKAESVLGENKKEEIISTPEQKTEKKRRRSGKRSRLFKNSFQNSRAKPKSSD